MPVKASLFIWLLCYVDSFQIVSCCVTEPGCWTYKKLNAPFFGPFLVAIFLNIKQSNRRSCGGEEFGCCMLFVMCQASTQQLYLSIIRSLKLNNTGPLPQTCSIAQYFKYIFGSRGLEGMCHILYSLLPEKKIPR